MASELLEIAKATKRAASFSIEGKFFIRDGKFYEIGLTVYPKYQSLPEQLRRYSKAEKRYSLKVITTMVDGYIVDLQGDFSTIDDARSKVDTCLRILSTAWPNQTVLHELHGVSFIGMARPFAIAGARVARFTSTDYIRLTKINRVMGKAIIPDRKERNEVQDWFRKRLDALRGTTVVWCPYAAEQTRAEELSLDTMRWVVLLLKYAYMSLYRRNGKTGISIAAGQNLVNLIVLQDSAGNSSLCSAAPYSEWPGSLHIVSSTRAKMRKAGVFVLSDIVEKSASEQPPAPESFRATLLQAVQWTVDSLDQTNNASRILAMTVALETLFSEDRDHLRSQVADGTAMVLTRDPLERENISTRMGQLYDMRSAVIHGRKKPVTDAEVLELQDKVTSVISVLCHHVNDYLPLSDFWNAISLAKRSGQIFK
jgi:hypothetical protein